MNPVVLLRVASIVTLLYFAGHMMGMPWTPQRGPEVAALVDAMKSRVVEVQGFRRSFFDFYLGFGLVTGALLLMQAVLLWQLASVAKADALRARPLIATIAIAMLVHAAIIGLYFFAIPMAMAGVIVVLLALAFLGSGAHSKTG